ncbi:MAG: PQQ-binding-like beta-propeller repeat protein [Pyrinomonadaceae bacterium]
MYRLLIELSIAAAILVFVLPRTAISQNSADWRLPIHKCWSNEADLSFRANASDNEKTIVSPLADDKIRAFDSRTGEILWDLELNGRLTSQIVVDEKTLYFAVSPHTADIDEQRIVNVSDFKRQTPLLTAVDIDSGLNNWTLDYLSVPDSATEFSILTDEKTLYVLSGSGEISAIEKKTRSMVWSRELGTSLSAVPFYQKGLLFIGTNNKTVITISALTGEITGQIPIGFEPTSIAAADGLLFAGDKEGNISTVEIEGTESYWKSFAGGEIVDISRLGQDILVSSNDNFAYRFSARNGAKVWKRKLSGRLLGNAYLDGMTAAFLSVGSSEVLLIDLENGKIVNRITAPDEGYFVSSPISIDNKLVLPTNKGLKAFSPLCSPNSTSEVSK